MSMSSYYLTLAIVFSCSIIIFIKIFGLRNFYKNFIFSTITSYVIMICLLPVNGDSYQYAVTDNDYGHIEVLIPGVYFSKYLISNLLGLIFLIFGASIPMFMSKKIKNNTNWFLTEKIIDSKTQVDLVYKISVAIFIFCLPFIIWYVWKTDGGPFLQAVSHSGDENFFIVEREKSFKWLDPRWGLESATYMFYPLLFIRTTIFPIVLCLLATSLIQNYSKRKLLIAVPIFLVVSYYALYTMARAPFAALLLRMFIAVYLVKYFKFDKIFLASLVAIILVPIFITMPIYGSSFVDTIIKIYNRLIVGPTNDVYQYIHYCGNIIEFLNGETLIRPILQFFNQPVFYLENEIYKYLYPAGIFSGHNNAAYIANAYCDFGYLGVISVSIVLGALMSALHIYLVSQPKTLISCTWYAFLFYLFWVINFGSITSIIFANGLIVSTIIFRMLFKVVYEKKYRLY